MLLPVLAFFLPISMSSIIHLRSGPVDTSTTPGLRAHEFGTLGDDRRLFIVQLKPPITAAKKQPLEEALGQQLEEYLPEDAFLVYATPARVSRVVDSPGVAWVGAYRPEHKFKAPVVGQQRALLVTVADTKLAEEQIPGARAQSRGAVMVHVPEGREAAEFVANDLATLPFVKWIDWQPTRFKLQRPAAKDLL